MYYYGDKPTTVEGYDDATVDSTGTKSKNKWLLPVGIGVGVLILVGLFVLMKKKKPTQKFGFKFY